MPQNRTRRPGATTGSTRRSTAFSNSSRLGPRRLALVTSSTFSRAAARPTGGRRHWRRERRRAGRRARRSCRRPRTAAPPGVGDRGGVGGAAGHRPWVRHAARLVCPRMGGVGRACLRAGRTVLTWLGPLGRALLRLARPVARAVKRAWDRLGLRAVPLLFRPLGRWARRLAAATHRGADWVVRQGGRLVAKSEPVLRVLPAVTAAVARTAAAIAAFARRCWAPVARFTARISPSEVSQAGRAPGRASEPGP